MHTSSSQTVTGRIDAAIYDADMLSSQFSEWHELNSEQKLARVDEASAEDSFTVRNETVRDFHNYLARNVNPEETGAAANLGLAYLGLGDDAASGTDVGDSQLNNRVFTKQVTDHQRSGRKVTASTFVESDEANGESLEELGLFTGDPANLGNSDVFLVNHTTFSTLNKSSDETVVFEVSLTFGDK